jgi:hypothetical protein
LNLKPEGPGQPRGFYIFVSYRRDDAPGTAYRLVDYLTHPLDDEPRFTKDQIFVDISAARPGEDFRDVIREAVIRSDLVLTIIGTTWLGAELPSGRRRLDESTDVVRLELEAAFERRIPVIPVLVHGADMPHPNDLPESLSELAYRQAIEVSYVRWDEDTGRLLAFLKDREQATLRRRDSD